MFKDNKDFYPTPDLLIRKMWSKLKKSKSFYEIKYILEPHGGNGSILNFMKENISHKVSIRTIEKDPQLRAMLQGQGYNVVDSDFLTYAGHDKYDLIIANPPFSNGAAHLLKAIDITYSGKIIFLLNAETILNPHTNERKILVKKLKELDAEIEYIDNAFLDAERTAPVKIAMVYISIKRDVRDDLLVGATDIAEEINPSQKAHEQKEITQKDSIVNLVAAYNRAVEIGIKSLMDFYTNFHHISPYLGIIIMDRDNTNNNYYSRSAASDLNVKMKSDLNGLVENVRKDYWQTVLTMDKVRKRMTVKKREEFNISLQRNSFMDFTESNIQQFILNLANNYEGILKEAVQDVFKTMTMKHSYHEKLHVKNVHYFDGWKTNKAYYVNNKVVLPFYDDAFLSWSGAWSVSYQVKERIDDIDKVMNYFDGRSEYISIANALDAAFTTGQTTRIESTYFRINVYKKGTMHLTFLNKDVLRRFNVTACKEKNWLPEDYGRKNYQAMTREEQVIVDLFEGKKQYTQHVTTNDSLFRIKDSLMLEAT